MITGEKTHKKPTENTSKEMELHFKNNRNTTRHQVTAAVAEKGGEATIWRGHASLRGINACEELMTLMGKWDPCAGAWLPDGGLETNSRRREGPRARWLGAFEGETGGGSQIRPWKNWIYEPLQNREMAGGGQGDGEFWRKQKQQQLREIKATRKKKARRRRTKGKWRRKRQKSIPPPLKNHQRWWRNLTKEGG